MQHGSVRYTAGLGRRAPWHMHRTGDVCPGRERMKGSCGYVGSSLVALCILRTRFQFMAVRSSVSCSNVCPLLSPSAILYLSILSLPRKRWVAACQTATPSWAIMNCLHWKHVVSAPTTLRTSRCSSRHARACLRWQQGWHRGLELSLTQAMIRSFRMAREWLPATATITLLTSEEPCHDCSPAHSTPKVPRSCSKAPCTEVAEPACSDS